MKKYQHIPDFFLLLLFMSSLATSARASGPGNPTAYRVGIDYHATSADLANSTFMSQYHKPEVRAQVLSQLQGMADAGAKVISTRLWMTGPVGGLTNFNLGFPLSAQELQNIRQYAQDVSSIKGKNGQYLDLYFILLYLNCASYKWFPGPCPTIDPNKCNVCYSWDQYANTVKKTYDDFFNTIGDVTRPDGKKAVTLAYFDGEVVIQDVNTDKMLTQLYPYFVNDARTHGIEPTLYFMIYGPQTGDVFNDNYTNPAYPAINGHPSLAYIYPTIEFMKKNNIPIPQRLDMSIYPSNNIPLKNNTSIINRVLDDLREFYPNNDIGVSETNYFQDQAQRWELGQAFAHYYLSYGEPKETFFWTTPDSGGPGINAAYPFDVASYLPTTNPIGNYDSATCTESIGWTCDPYNYQTLSVHFYANGPSGAGGTYIGQTVANLTREPAVGALCGGYSAHGFRFITPNGLKDGLPHSIYAYAINLNPYGVNPLLGGSPKIITCSTDPADLNGDGKVDIYDYNILVADFGKTGTPGWIPADIIKDGKVDIYDYNMLVGNFGK
jgi:hypothetical protein